MRRSVSLLALMLLLACTAAYAQKTGWEPVVSVLGRTGTIQGDVLRVAFPRTDLHVQIGSIPVSAPLALGSWIGFQRMGNQTMMMGDLVLLTREVYPVLRKMNAHGIQLTGLHNHIFGETPQVMYLHYKGQGDPVRLARVMRDILSVTKTPMGKPASPRPSSVNWSNVERTLGRTGQHHGKLLQITVPRADRITDDGEDVPPAMGTGISLNMEMIGTKAATTGDFVLVASEVNPVVTALTESGITVTAVHNHM
ncbi:MAG: LppY/LpqO family protein, partial [Armatimonadota bacterium]